MPKFKQIIAAVLVMGTAFSAFALDVRAAESESDARTSLLILEAARAHNQTDLDGIEKALSDDDTKIAHWQPLLENSSRLDEWMHSVEGRQNLRNFEAKPDSRAIREALALRISAIATERELLASDAETISAALVENQAEIGRLKKSMEFSKSVVRAPAKTAAVDARYNRGARSGS